jgi:hypothetical protein
MKESLDEIGWRLRNDELVISIPSNTYIDSLTYEELSKRIQLAVNVLLTPLSIEKETSEGPTKSLLDLEDRMYIAESKIRSLEKLIKTS